MTITSTPRRWLTIRPARTAAEVDAVLCGRHRVYSEESDYFQRGPPTAASTTGSTPTRTPPSTSSPRSTAASSAGVRYCLHDPRVGLPVDEFFDFSPHVRPDDRLVCGGMMFVARRRRQATASRPS